LPVLRSDSPATPKPKTARVSSRRQKNNLGRVDLPSLRYRIDAAIIDTSIHRLPAMRAEEELPGHLRSHPRPISSRQRSAGGKAGRRLDRREALCHFEAERADISINDLEGDPESRRVLVVALGEVGSFKLLLPELGQRVQAAAEQCSHLLSGHQWHI
jgi:hypothetical protein